MNTLSSNVRTSSNWNAWFQNFEFCNKQHMQHFRAIWWAFGFQNTHTNKMHHTQKTHRTTTIQSGCYKLTDCYKQRQWWPINRISTSKQRLINDNIIDILQNNYSKLSESRKVTAAALPRENNVLSRLFFLKLTAFWGNSKLINGKLHFQLNSSVSKF